MAIPQQALSLQDKVQKIVMAGMKVMYDPSTSQMLLDGVTAQTPTPQKLAMEVAGVMTIVHRKSANGLPPETVAPAAMMLLFELAQFMKQAGAGDPSKEDIAAAMPLLRQALSSVFKDAPQAAQAAQPQPAPQGIISQQQGA